MLDTTADVEEASMSTAQLDRTATARTCDGCGESVLSIFTTEQRPVVLDAVAVPSGLYVIDGHNRARRRGLVELYRDASRPTAGYDRHECKPVPWYERG